MWSYTSANRVASPTRTARAGRAASPPMYGQYPPGTNTNGTLFFYLLPFMEEGALYDKAAGNIYASPPDAHTKPMKMFRCPSDGEYGDGLLDPGNPWALGCYGGNFQVFGAPDAASYPAPNMQGQAKLPGSIPDGTAYTILFAEKYS